jgi:hypothetical protein
VVYFLSIDITKNSKAALFASFVSSFVPIYFSETINNLSIYSLIIPLLFFTFYFFIKISKEIKYTSIFIILLAILRLSHPSVVILILVLLVYLLLLKIERIKQSRAEIEIILFSTFIITWSLFITFKKPFLVHGPWVIWQNIPKQILTNYFSELTILEGIYKIGIVPFVSGLYTIYYFLFKEKNKKVYLLISVALTVLLLLWLKLIQLSVGLMFLGIVLSILFSLFYELFFKYFKKTRFSDYNNIFLIILFLIIVFSSVIPSLYSARIEIQKAVTNEEIKALKWIRRNTENNTTILSALDEGHLITSIANRKNVIDTNFILIKNIDHRLKDIRRIYNSIFETQAISLLNKYNVNYIYFSPRAKEVFGISELEFVKDSECFENVYNNTVEIYKSLCIIEER